MIDLVSAAIACPTPEEAFALTEKTASDLKLGKPLYRKRTSEGFAFHAALPGPFHLVTGAPGFGVFHDGYYRLGNESRELAIAAFEMLTAPMSAESTITLELRLEQCRYDLVHSTRAEDSEGGSGFFCLAPSANQGPTVDVGSGLPSVLLDVWGSRDVPGVSVSLAEAENGRLAKQFDRMQGNELNQRLENMAWRSVSIKGGWDELIELVSPIKSVVRDDVLQEVRLSVAADGDRFEQQFPSWRERVGRPDCTSTVTYFPSKKWTPFDRPEGLGEDEQLRIPLHFRARGAFQTQLDILHRTNDVPMLDLQVLDYSGKNRAEKEMQKQLAKTDLSYQVWDRDLWGRWETAD